VRVVRLDERLHGGEPVADLEVKPEIVPMAFDIDGALVPRLIDEFLATADAQALDATCLDSLHRPSFFVSTARVAP
jgi:hypothetical protein